MKRKSISIIVVALLVGAVSIGLVASPPFMVHEQRVHQELNLAAANLVRHHDQKKGFYSEIYIPAHKNELWLGAYDEDESQIIPRALNHFYHAEKGDGLPIPFITDAISWAYDSGGLTWKSAIESYEGDSDSMKGEAYLRLGHVAHLLGDMSQPDHVHLELHCHGDECWDWLKDPHQWETWGKDFVSGAGDSFLKTNEPPFEFLHLDGFMKSMANISYNKSRFGGLLRKDKTKPAVGQIYAMFDVAYEIIYDKLITTTTDEGDTFTFRDRRFGWILRDKTDHTIVAYWDGKPLYERHSKNYGPETTRPELQNVGVFYDICTETTNWSCFDVEVPNWFYIEDIEHAIPAKYKGKDNPDRYPLAYFYATELLPMAVRHIAGLYMHFYDIVNAPPYVKKVTAKQDGEPENSYQNEWKVKPKPREIGNNKAGTLKPLPKNKSVFRREWAEENKSEPFAIDKKITLEVTFSEPVKDVKVTLEDFGQIEFKTKNREDADSIWEGTFAPKGSIVIPPDATEISRTLTIKAKDLHNHLSRTKPGRIDEGVELDSEPNSVAKATYIARNQYGWSGYTSGADLNHKLTFGKPVEPVMFLLDTSGSMGRGKIQQAQRSARRALQTLRDNQQQGGKASVVAIKTFSGECNSQTALKPLLEFTTELDKVNQALKADFNTGGGTPLHLARTQADSVVRDYLDKTGTAEGTIFLLTDGMDTCQSTRPTGVYSRAPVLPIEEIKVKGKKRQAAVRYLTVGFGLAPNSPADRDLQYLAAMSGGRHYNTQNQRQLTRAFSKLLKAYIPKPATHLSALAATARNFLQAGSMALKSRNYGAARTAFAAYTKSAPADPVGFFNLALALEASDRYKSAAAQYRRYLELASTAPDRQKVEALIPELEQDYVEYFTYQVELIKNDHAYLEKYYQRLFNQSNATLAAEFSGFVREKGEFYSNLPDVLELDVQWLKQDTRSLSSGIKRIAKRINKPTFDRDAVSLLAVPIKRLEKIVEKLEIERDKMGGKEE